jgi:hypothetical protein
MKNVLIALGAAFLLLGPAGAKEAAGPAEIVEIVETFDSRSVSGRIVSMTADRAEVADADGKKHTFARQDLARIVMNDPAKVPDAMAQTSRTVLVTAAGDLIPVQAVALADDRLTVTSTVLGKVTLPVDAVAMIYLAQPSLSAGEIRRRCEKMKLRRAADDQVVLTKKGENWLIVNGVLKSIDERTVTLTWKGSDRMVNREMVPAMYLAATGDPPAGRRAVLTGTDGTRLALTDLAIPDATGEIELSTPHFGTRKVPRSAIAEIRFASDKVTDLADLKPVEVKEHGFFDTTFHHRRNLSAGGRPLRLGKRPYKSGLGLHSFCELTYDLAGAYRMLVALVGIDDATDGRGDAALTVLGDGKPLTPQPLRLRGNDKPQPLRLTLTGVRRLTLRVDFGADALDVGDHVDIVAARLIK